MTMNQTASVTQGVPLQAATAVLAALRVNGVQSGFSEQSNLISKYMEEGEEGGGGVR